MKAKVNKLSDIDSRNPFLVPENYFENLNDEAMSRLPQKEIIEPIKVSLWTKVKLLVYLAAMFVGAFFFIQVLFNTTGTNIEDSTQQDAVANQYISSTDKYWSNVQVTEDEFYNYLEDQLASDGYYDYMYNQVSF